jgi:hypothetical protein
MLHKPTHILVCTTILNNPVHRSIEKWCKSEKIKYGIIMDPDEFLEAMEALVEKKDEKDHIILIFDDFNQSKKGCNDVYNNFCNRAFSKYRNYNVSSIYISPNPTDLPTNSRNSCNIRVLFPCMNIYGIQEVKKDIKGIFPQMGNDFWACLYDKICNNPYTFILFTDTKGGEKKPHLRLSWDEIVYPTDADKEKAPETLEKRYDRRTMNHHQNYDRLVKRNMLINKCVEMGLPRFLSRYITDEGINNFLEYVKKNGSVKDMDEEKLIEMTKKMGITTSTKPSLMRRLMSNIKRYSETEEQKYWVAINKTCTDLIENGHFTKEQMKFYLQKYGLL